MRKTIVVLTLLATSLVVIPVAAGPLPPGGSFIDDDGSTHEPNIEAIAADDITQGCDLDGIRFCPLESVTRAQMATFLVRALELPPTATDYFTDDTGLVHEDNINALREAGVTEGCGGTNFCPQVELNRAQMATFLVRALGLAPTATDYFIDDTGLVHEDNINALRAADITQGCTALAYCPGKAVTRAQMATFLTRGLGLIPMTPPPRPDIELAEVYSGLGALVHVAAPPGDPRLFIVAQSGVIWVDSGSGVEPFFDISSEVNFSGERGLFAIAFHPEFDTNDKFYVNYINRSGGSDYTVIDEYKIGSDPDRANLSSKRELLRILQPASNHNGGMLAFGPDGYLYIGMGDGGGGGDPFENGQDTNTLHGAMLRIDVDSTSSGKQYGIPADNPFAGGGGAPEVWSYGLRNPWRFSFDGNNLYIGDVGQGAREEIDAVAVTADGYNFGWDIMEGELCFEPSSNCPTGGLTLPVLSYGRNDGRSVTGGYVYRGATLPTLFGHYFYADYSTGFVRSFRLAAGSATDEKDWSSQFGFVGNITGFGVDGSDELYLVTSGGKVFKFQYEGS